MFLPRFRRCTIDRISSCTISRTLIERKHSQVIRSFLFGKDDTQNSSEKVCVELSQLSPDKVDSVVEEVLSERGVNYLEPFKDLRIKFNVLKDVERKFNVRIPSSQLNTLVNVENIKDFLLFHQQRNKSSAKLFTIDTSSLPPNLSIKQPTLRVGPKKHVIRDPSDPDNYEHYPSN